MRQESNHHWFRLWLVAWSAPSHHLNQRWTIINWTLRNKLQRNLIEILTFSFKKMGLKVLSGKWRPFRLGLNYLTAKLKFLHDMTEIHHNIPIPKKLPYDLFRKLQCLCYKQTIISIHVGPQCNNPREHISCRNTINISIEYFVLPPYLTDLVQNLSNIFQSYVFYYS